MRCSIKWYLDCWQSMTLIRRAEEAIAEMVEKGEVGCPCHLCVGQEAVAAGVCAALKPEDTVWGGHRSHGHYLAKGGPLEGLFAEVLGKTTGCAAGRGGSMHLVAKQQGILGTVPIVAGTVSLAVGAALAYKLRGEKNVAVAFFGDGTVEEGQVHESLNLAALYRLPVIFVCENNLYSSHMHWKQRRVTDNLYRAGEFHSVPGHRLDGNDVAAVYEATRKAVKRAHAQAGPTLLECRTFRWRGHVGASYDLDVGVKRRGELTGWMRQDPIRRVADHLIDHGVADLAAREHDIALQIEHALQAARNAPAPLSTRLRQFVYAAAVGTSNAGAGDGGGADAGVGTSGPFSASVPAVPQPEVRCAN
jgi:TPP-dependent pyruvate/acetoin dehydrogenase alpha subunit